MTIPFTASNGCTVEATLGGRMRVTDNDPDQDSSSAVATQRSVYLDPNQIAAVRKFFQHERDEYLGRWRDPLKPSFVVYPESSEGKRVVRVMHEKTGHSVYVEEGGRLTKSTRVIAARYFAAHPEPKPWHDAGTGEAWILTVDGQDGAWLSGITTAGTRFVSESAENIPTDHPSITDGRRIYPEDD